MDGEDPPTVAVTGAAGYTGSRVVRQLRDEHPDWDLLALDDFSSGQVRKVGDVTVREVDIRDRGHLEATLDGADVVLHLAAVSGVNACDANPDLAYEVNVVGTDNVAWFCRKTGAALVFASSMAVLGDPDSFPVTVKHPRSPLNWYGRTKLLGEHAIRDFAADAFPAHLFLKSNLYGDHVVGDTRVSKDTVVELFVDSAVTGEALTVHEPGTQARNFVHVNDVAHAYVRSAEQMCERLAAGETGVTKYEIGSREDLSVMSVAEHVRRGAREVLNREVEITITENPRDETTVTEFGVDIERAERDLGWRPAETVGESVRRSMRDRAPE